MKNELGTCSALLWAHAGKHVHTPECVSWVASRSGETAQTELATILCGAAQILDVVKSEWGAAWSEWDQSIRDGISKLLAHEYAKEKKS